MASDENMIVPYVPNGDNVETGAKPRDRPPPGVAGAAFGLPTLPPRALAFWELWRVAIRRFGFVVIIFTIWPQAAGHLGSVCALILQGIVNRWLLCLELFLRSFQDSIAAFCSATWHKWGHWIAYGQWPEVYSDTNGTHTFASDQAPETPRAFAMVFACLLWYATTLVRPAAVPAQA